MRYQIISLKNPATNRRVFLTLSGLVEIRRKTFREVAQDAKLQGAVLAMIGKHRTLRDKFILELAKNPRLRRMLLKLCS